MLKMALLRKKVTSNVSVIHIELFLYKNIFYKLQFGQFKAVRNAKMCLKKKVIH